MPTNLQITTNLLFSLVALTVLRVDVSPFP